MQNRIKELRQSGGMTAAQLADQVGTSASQIVKLERGERRLTQEWMIRLAAVLGCAPADIMGGGFLPQDGVYDAPARPHPAPGPATGLMETQRAFLTGQPPAHSGFADVADLPVLGAAKGGSGGMFFDNGQPFEYIRRPGILIGVAAAYAVYVVGDSMAPRYEPGEMVFVNPNRPLARGCYVVVELDDGEGLVKRFVRGDDRNVVLEQFNPPQEIHLTRQRVRNLHRIVGAAEHA